MTAPALNPTPGQSLPVVTMEITKAQMAMATTPTLDVFPGHYDAEYARSVGHRTVFMNTMPLLGLLDRAVTDWTGEAGFVHRHSIVMQRPTYAGTTVHVSGEVVDVKKVEGPTSWTTGLHVDIDLKIKNSDGLCVLGKVTVVISDR